MSVGKSVLPIHFEDIPWHQFERLVFAHLLRTERWASLDWYGQSGSDCGRDIWGVREKDTHPTSESVCIQCANHQVLSFTKVEHDFRNVLNGPNGKPDVFLVVASGKVSANLRDKAQTLCTAANVRTEIWSGGEFEERLRHKSESLLLRIFHGEEFPDSPAELKQLLSGSVPMTDDEMLGLIAICFDRPAFYTPFYGESCLPAFRKAITDTIEVLNTGVYRLRDGTEIRRIPSRHQLNAESSRLVLEQIVKELSSLRARFDEGINCGEVHPCGCDVPDCPVFHFTPSFAHEMDQRRTRVLDSFRGVFPAFTVQFGF